MGRRTKVEPNPHAIYMREWRKRHPENADAQRAYQQQYLADPVNREAARRRAQAWYRKNRNHARARYRETYVARVHPHHQGEQHPLWKGDNAGYAAIHAWVRRHRGSPDRCERCPKRGKRFHWANIDHRYRRVLADYFRVCPTCHYKYDVEHGLQPPLDGRAGGLASARCKSERRTSGR